MNPVREQEPNLTEPAEDASQSQYMLVKNELAERTNNNAETNNEINNSHASKNTEMEKRSTSFDYIKSFLENTNKSNSSIHGNLYHVHVALISCLQLFEQCRQDDQFDFIFSVEVAAAGKFDDIMYHTESGTWFMQLKHKMGESKITEKDLCSTSGTFSLLMYFESYLEVDKMLQTNHICPWYALCTNASAEEIKDFLQDYVERDPVVEMIFDDIKTTRHQFDPARLLEKLKEPCLERLGALMVKPGTSNVKSGTDIIIFDNGLLNVFASLLKEFLQPFEAKSDDPSVAMYTIENVRLKTVKAVPEKEKFFNAFKKEFSSNCKAKQLNVKIDKESLNAAVRSEWKTKFDQAVRKYCKKLVLVANSPDEVAIREQANTKLPVWCKVEHDALLAKLKEQLIDALKSPVSIGRQELQQIFRNLESKEPIATLMCESREFLDSLKQKYTGVAVNDERLKESELYKFVAREDFAGMYEFSSYLDLEVCAHIIGQTLSLHQYETLVLHSEKYQAKENALQDLLSYLRDVDHPTIKAVAILGKLEEGDLCEIKNLCARYRRKLIIMGTATPGCVESDTFLVRDLQEKEILFHQHKQLNVFGTVTSLRSIIQDADSLSLLMDALKLCQQAEQLESDTYLQHYQKIEPWYIHRTFVPLDTQEKQRKRTEEEKQDIGELLFHLSPTREAFHRQATVLISSVATRFRAKMNSALQNSIRSLNDETIPNNLPGVEMKRKRDSNVCIFLNEAGEGKTTYLTWLAWKLSTNDRSLFVIKLIALEYSTDFERLVEGDIDGWCENRLVRFLYRLTHLALFVPNVCRRTIEETDVHRAEADRCAKALTLSNGTIVFDATETKELTTRQVIELRLFAEKFNTQQLLLIIDGFDEIVPDYKDVVMKVLTRFSHLKSIRRMYLSSQPYDFKQEFKLTFPNCHLYQLKTFSVRDVCTFLHKRLALNIDDYRQWEPKDQNSLLTVLYVIIVDILGDSVTVPLLLAMTFVTLLPSLREQVNFQTATMSGSILKGGKLNTLQLVEKFVAKKMELLLTDKSGATDSAALTPAARHTRKIVYEHEVTLHTLLAVYSLFERDARVKLLSSAQQARAIAMLQVVKEAEDKTGIICGVHDERPAFVHRLLAEYFVAVWLRQHWEGFKRDPIYQSQLLWNGTMENVRRLFNLMVLKESKGCELHRAVMDRNETRMKEIFQNDPVAVTVEEDAVGRSALHVEVGRRDKIRFSGFILLLNRMPPEIVTRSDNLLGWSAIDYAFVLNDKKAVQNLLEHKAQVSEEILMRQLFSNDTDMLIEQGAKYVYILQYCGLAEIAHNVSARVVERLLTERKLDIFAARRKLKGQSALELCAARQDGSLFFQFVERIGKPFSQALPAGMGDRLYEKAFKFEAHQIIKYLVEKCDIPLPSTVHTHKLYKAIEHTVVKNDFNLFEKLFQCLCRQSDITCGSAVAEEVHQPLAEEFGNGFDAKCCVWGDINVGLSLPKYNVDEESMKSISWIFSWLQLFPQAT